MNYVILSEGEYSDYCPNYYVGSRNITQEALHNKGKEVGDSFYGWFAVLPKRIHMCKNHFCYTWCPKEETYDPETGNLEYSGNLSKKWFDIMEKWLLQSGFEKLPKNIPEINVAYSTIPSNHEN